MRWINIKDELPPLNNKPVLVTDFSSFYCVTLLKDNFNSELIWEDSLGFHYDLDEFKSWMPIPV